MRRLKALLCGLAIAGLASVATVGLGSHPANADNFSFTGSFTNDSNVQLFNFSVAATSSITLRTFSYAGGTNSAGTVIPEGGFIRSSHCSIVPARLLIKMMMVAPQFRLLL